MPLEGARAAAAAPAIQNYRAAETK